MRGSRAGESAGGTTLVVVNPMSGGGRTGRQWPQLRAALHQAGIDFEYRLTAARGEAIELTRDGLRAGAVRVVAVRHVPGCHASGPGSGRGLGRGAG